VLTQHQDLVLLVGLETQASVGHGLGNTPAMIISKSLGIVVRGIQHIKV
jgi:hypothetical protein